MPYKIYTVYIISISLLAFVVGNYFLFDDGTPPKQVPRNEQLFNQFSSEIVPVLNVRCNNCHAIETKKYKQVAENLEDMPFARWEVNAGGDLETLSQQKIAYRRFTDVNKKSSRKFSPLGFRNDYLASPVLRVPLANKFSGVRHPEIFSSVDDPDFKKLTKWVKAEIEFRRTAPPRPLTTNEKFFAKNIIPILSRKNCFGCHGLNAFNDLKMDAGIPAYKDRFTDEMIRYNRKAMLGTKTRQVNLSGAISRSRQLVKNIPVSDGGVIHKGGNHFFRKDDPDFKILSTWIELEKKFTEKAIGKKFDKWSGIVFVRRPNATPERFFEDNNFLPGGDLILLKDGVETNLTEKIHPGQLVDIRAPSVSYDAKKIIFSLRLSKDEAFNLWEIDLETRGIRQITFSENSEIHYQDPIFIPDPDDTKGTILSRYIIAFTSNREKNWGQTSSDGFLGEAESGTSESITDTDLTYAPGTFNGHSIEIVRGTNKGQKRIVLTQENGVLTVDKPFAEPCDSTTHYVISSPARSAQKYDLYRMRYPAAGKEKDNFLNNIKRMSFSIDQIRRPSVRSTGELMFTALRTGWQEDRPFFNGAIYRTHIDGSNIHIHNGNRSGVPILSDNRELPSGLEVRIGRDYDSWWGGMLIISDHQFGVTIEPNNPLDNLDHPYKDGKPKTSIFRFVPGWITLDETIKLRGISPGGTYRDPFPLPDGSIIVSYAKGPIDLSNPDEKPDFNIVRLFPAPSFQSEDGFSHGNYRRETLVSGPDSELWARPLAARLKEPVKKTLKHDERLFGKPVVINGFMAYPDKTAASLEVLDLFLLDSFFYQTVPVGAKPVSRKMMDKQIKFARIITAESASEKNMKPVKRILAEVPVEKDGSLYVKIPSNISFDIQSLNSERMALKSSGRWLYTHPGEKHALSIPAKLFTQTCAGCHGGLSGDKNDTFISLDAVTSASKTVATWDKKLYKKRVPLDITGKSHDLTVDFNADILPIFQKKCMSCHAVDYLHRFVDKREGRAIRSYLMEKLLGKELQADKSLKGNVPHPAENPLIPSELLKFIRWIDLGAE